MKQLKIGSAVVRGALAPVLVASLLSSPALAAPVDLSKWSPEYVRSIAGTETFDTAEACGKVTPLDYKGRLTFWYQGVFEGDPDLLRQYYADFFETFRKTYPNIQLEEQALQARVLGVLQMTLRPSSYDWSFVPVSGSYSDTGSGTCR